MTAVRPVGAPVRPVTPGVTAGRARIGLLAREARIVGPLALALPAGTVVAVLVSALTLVVAAEWDEARRVLVAGLEAALPLAAGVAAAVAVTGERSVELQLSLPVPYRGTALRRVALVAGAGGASGLAVTALLAAAGVLPGPGAVGGFVLLWAAPLAWFVAAGAVAGLALGRAAGGGLLAAVWLAQQFAGGLLGARVWTRPLWLFVTSQAGRVPDWTLNRMALLIQAAVLAAAAWTLLRRSDHLMEGAQE